MASVRPRTAGQRGGAASPQVNATPHAVGRRDVFIGLWWLVYDPDCWLRGGAASFI